MHRSFYFLIVLLFPVLSFSQEWKPFTDTAGNFTAKYPSNWINKIKEGNRVFFTSPIDTVGDDFFENINISVTSKAGYGTEIKIKDLFPSVTETIKEQFNDFKDEGLRYFKWNGIDAAEISYSGLNKLNEYKRIRTIQWYCFYRSRLYIATFVADAGKNKYNATANRIMNSIIFK